MKKPELSIIIPVYNESENIILTLDAIKQKVTTKNEILVVYDHPKDTTLPVLKKVKNKYKNLYVIKNTIARGPSGAIRTGLKKANSELILVTMADLCDDLKQVDRMVKIAKRKVDLVCPSRYTKGGKQELDSYFKVGFPKMAGRLMHVLTGIKTVDPTNSYKLFKKSILKKMHLRSTISFSVTLEIVAKTHLLGGNIYEIPTIWKDRQHGKTHFKLGRSIVAYTPWLTLSLFKNRLFNASFLVRSLI